MAGAGVKLGLACLLAEVPLAGAPTSGATSALLTSSGEGLVSSGRASFSVTFKQQVNPYPVLGLFVMPGEQVPLQVLADSARSYTIAAGGGHIEPLAGARWVWTAPEEKGLYPIMLRDSVTDDAVIFNAFVLVPAPPGTTLNGFRIGRYPSRPLRGDPHYATPRGFVEVTEENQGTLVAPHFALGQFVSKQPGGYPKYIVLQEQLLLELESLLEQARRRGIAASTFRIMSGYRTPYYNRRIGNETSYSRHVYGDAADIYVDEDGDGRMDDLDRDGRVTLGDARVLARVVESLSDRWGDDRFEGGLGFYGATRSHGPFVHVDTRGWRARWGPQAGTGRH
jgi:hypothetical protein